MLNQVIKTSPHDSFKLTQICESVVICEAVKGDQHGWGNATNGEPAFLVYLGCQKDEVKGYVKTFNTFYRTEWCEVRKPKHLKGFSSEIKIRGMVRYSDTNAFGLDYLISSEEAKHYTTKRIWEYDVILQSNEQDPDTGVPDDTSELLVQFFSPQNKKSLTSEYSETGYHLVTFELRQIQVKLDGDNFYRPIWQAPWVGNEDEF